ncbi:MAG: hypothetical protein IPK64_07185 [bacterium]|nr:hypothetical protein [bacterium]
MGRLSCSLLIGRRPYRSAACRLPATPTGIAVSWLVVAVSAASGAGSAQGAALPSAVQESTPAGLTLAVQGLEPSWSLASPGPDGGPRFHLTMDGYPGMGAPGTPIVPVASSWLVVPPGTRPQVRVMAESWRSEDGRRLAFASQPVFVPDEGAAEPVVRELVLEPDAPMPAGVVALRDFAGADKGHVGPAVVVDEPTWWRGRRVASLRLVPVRYDADGSVRQTLAAGRWEIVFVPDAAVKVALPAANARLLSGARDVRFAASFLNGDLLGAMPTEGQAAGIGADPDRTGSLSRSGAKAALLGAEARLAVTRTGPVRVSFDRLRQRDLIPDVPIQESQVRLYQRRYLSRLDTGQGAPYVEVEVPIHMVGEGDAFAGDDFFVFHALRLRDDSGYLGDLGSGPETIPGCGDPYEMNNDANLYWLACATPGTGQSWARMATTAIAPMIGTPLANFRHQGHYEEQSAFRENLPATTVDRMYANLHTERDASLAITPFWRPDPAGASVDVSVGLAGWNNFRHAVTGLGRPVELELVTLATDGADTTLLEATDIKVSSATVRNYSVPASALDGSTAKVSLSMGVGAVSFLFVYLNWIEVAYDALYQAVGNELRFHGGDAAGSRPIEVTGFTSADIGLLEVTDPRAPVFVTLQAGNVVADGATWKLSLMPQQSGTRREFHAVGGFGAAGVPEFNYLRSSVAADPVDPTATVGGAPDVIVVTHPEFRTSLERWVQHRVARSGGTLRLHVVDVDDLYDWYSGGLRDPWAIKRFCNHALTRWESWALVVAGDANENALGKRVPSQATAWGRDWVPTHYHTQWAGQQYEPELMATDKWYATLQSGQNYPVEDFLIPSATPFDMITGRFPCNSTAELDLMIDKVIALETPQQDQAWRRRGLFIADDEWSNGYGSEALLILEYSSGERAFLESERDSLAAQWADATGVALDAQVVSLKALLDPQFPYDPQAPGERLINPVRLYTAASATPVLLAALNQGALVASYQGHANQYVLSSEYWLQDVPTIPNQRVDTQLLANNGMPWFFMGLGCHISDWAQNPVKPGDVPQERSIGEKLLLRPNAGASAVYASSGYEFIVANRIFGEYISRRWTQRPPVIDAVGPGGSRPGRSRWVLGELLWAAESDLASSVSYRNSPYKEMLAQFQLLGDPLMTLDAGEPVIESILHGAGDQVVSGSVDLVALDETNTRTLTITARDEAGIDRLEVIDENGDDIAAQVAVETLPIGAQDHQRADYALTVPVRPYDHALTVKVYDTGAALPGDRHWELVLNMEQTATLTADGLAHDPQTFTFEAGVPVAFSGTVTTAAWLATGMELALNSATLALTDVSLQVVDKSNSLALGFTATAGTAGSATGHAVTLDIDGYGTELVLQAAPDVGEEAAIGRVLNYPNPMIDTTRFLVETGMSGQGRISLWSVAGSPVARVTFTAAGGGDVVVDWDGLDAHGDRLANGTYLYRVEIDGPSGAARSDVQRLVIMR